LLAGKAVFLPIKVLRENWITEKFLGIKGKYYKLTTLFWGLNFMKTCFHFVPLKTIKIIIIFKKSTKEGVF